MRGISLSTLRSLTKRWRTSLCIVLVLGLGATTSSAVFVVTDGVLLRPFPLAEPDRLVVVASAAKGRMSNLSDEELRELRTLPEVESVAGVVPGGVFEERYARLESLRVSGVTPNFFRTLGAPLRLGRAPEPRDASLQPRPIVISDALWRSRFNQDAMVLGRAERLGGILVRIVGVAAPGFDFPHGSNIWVGLGPSRHAMMPLHLAIVRLRTSAIPKAARLSTGPLLVTPLKQRFTPAGAQSLAILLLATLVAVLIGWTHLASLQVAQVLDRQGELAVRSALGASPWKLAQDWLAEAVVLGAAALAAGATVLPPAVSLAISAMPPWMTMGQPVDVGHRGFAYLGVLTAGGTAMLAVGPVLAARRSGRRDGLRRSSSVSGPGRSGRGRRLLLVAQVAMVTGLLYVTGIECVGLVELATRDVGVELGRLVMVDPLAGAGSATVDLVELAERVRSVPSVTAVVRGRIPVLAGQNLVSVVAHTPSFEEVRNADKAAFGISPGYFAALGIPVIWGSDEGTDRSDDLVLFSQSVARSLGITAAHRNTTVYVAGLPRRVAGVVADVWGDRPDPIGPGQYVYLSSREPPATLVVRTERGVAPVFADIERVIRQGTGIHGPVTATFGTDLAARLTAPGRGRLTVLAMLALSTLLLATVGIYGMASENARRCAQEDAIRAAVGATPLQILRRRLSSPLSTLLGGLALGLVAGVWAARLVSSLVHALRPENLIVGLAVGALLLAIGLLAALKPALRASRVDAARLLCSD